MKLTPFTLLLFLNCLLMLGTKVVAQENNPPAQTAHTYIEHWAHGEIKLSHDSALSKNCSPLRRKIIEEQVKLYANTHFRKNDQFAVETEKVQGNFAAVLIRSNNPLTPLTPLIHSIAMVKRHDSWLPAPIPGSFSNSGYGYNPDSEATVRQLEEWMVCEKSLRQQKLQSEAKKNFISSIKKEEEKAKLDKLTPKQAIENFILQCRNKNLIGIMAATGVGNNEFSDSLVNNVNTVIECLDIKNTSNEWFLVTNSSVPHLILKVDQKDKEIPVGFWNPFKRQKRIKILYFDYYKTNDKLYLKLPTPLKYGLLPKYERMQKGWQHPHSDTSTLIKDFPAKLIKAHSELDHRISAKVASDHFVRAISQNDFTQCIQLLPREGKYFSKKDNQKSVLEDFSNTWSDFQNIEGKLHSVHNLLVQGDLALLSLQYALVNRPGDFKNTHLWFVKIDSHWSIVPHNTFKKIADKTLLQTSKELLKKMADKTKALQEKLSNNILHSVFVITPPLKLDAPSDNQAKRTLLLYQSALKEKDATSALAQCALLKETSNSTTLKTLKYAIRGAADQTANSHILAINRSGKWTGISFLSESKASDRLDYPLYIFVNTPQGTKILLDTDLRYATNRGRKLINKKNWKKLEAVLDKSSLSQIKDLFSQHNKLVETYIKQNPPKN